MIRCPVLTLMARSLFVLCALNSQNVWGDLFFVSTTGDDLGLGTATDPWRTLQNAANTVNPGDTVTVQPGQYTGFELQTSGTANSPILFQAEAGVVINAPNARTPDGINLEGASYVTIDGFEVVGVPRAGIRAVGSPDDHSQFVTIRNNRADQNGRWGIFTGYSEDLLIEHNETSRSADEHGIYVSNSADRPTLRHNVSWGNNASGIQLNADGTLPGDGVITGALLANNRVYDNGQSGGAGLNLDGVQDSRIENNLLYRNHSTGIALFRIDGSDGSKRNEIVNNTVVNATDGRWAITITDGSTDNTLLNNIFFSEHSFRGGMDIHTDSLSGLISNFNAVEDRFTTNGGDNVFDLEQWKIISGQDADSVTATPSQLFVAAASDDYRLSPTSPGVDAGTLNSAPSNDLNGTLRPIGLGVDIGAIEVPEPTGLGLALWTIGLLGVMHRRKRHT